LPEDAVLRHTVAVSAAVFCFMNALVAHAGPPYLSDDPEPTGYEHFEIYAFASGTAGRDGSGGEAGIDFNYGATPDLQLTAVLPAGYARPSNTPAMLNLGNIELAAKYRFLHQDEIGWDVAVFPRVFLPAGSAEVGERHVSFLLPIWLGKNWGNLSTFGGGGCVLNQGGSSQNFCLAGWALTYQLLPKLQLGAEVFHQTADTKGGPTVQNAAETSRYTWYASVLFTF
jgi:hypothetical protein